MKEAEIAAATQGAPRSHGKPSATGCSLPVPMGSKEGEIHVSSVTPALLTVPCNHTVLDCVPEEPVAGAKQVLPLGSKGTMTLQHLEVELLAFRMVGR